MRIGEFQSGTAWAVLALLALTGCADKPLPPRSTLELMDDPAVLQAVLARCNASGELRDPECSHAREAVERMAADESQNVKEQKQAAAELEFDRAREELRQRDALERRRREASQNVDPYTMPLVEDAETQPVRESAVDASIPRPST